MSTTSSRLFSYYDDDAITFLESQHREIDQVLARLIRAPLARDKRRLLDELGDLVAVHLALEERVFYPGLYSGEPGGEGRSFVVLAVEDHTDLKRFVAELNETDVEDPGFDARAVLLRARILEHVGDEERRAFPKIRRRFSLVRLRRLAYRMRVLEFQLRTDASPRHLIASGAATSANA